MKAKENDIEMSREDIVDELVESFTENNDVYTIARYGIEEQQGYENMDDEELVDAYNEHFSKDIKMVE